jgi:lipopolysaccharide biosynthesis protein
VLTPGDLIARRDRAVRDLQRRGESGPLAPLFGLVGRRLWCGYRELIPLRQPLAGRTVCVFAHYDPAGRVEPYVEHHLRALARTDAVVLFISTAAALATPELRLLGDLCAAVVVRDNIGLDFGSWRTALLLYPGLLDVGRLFWANDSVYGPMHDLAATLGRLSEERCDFFGVSESLQERRHYQSYFLGFHRRCLRSPAFGRFYGRLRLLSDKDQVIRRYELGLTERLARAGLSGMALVPADRGRDPRENPTLHRWRELLAAGSPYLKVQLLRENPHRQPIDDWPEVVARYGYDPALIRHHLGRG